MPDGRGWGTKKKSGSARTFPLGVGSKGYSLYPLVVRGAWKVAREAPSGGRGMV